MPKTQWPRNHVIHVSCLVACHQAGRGLTAGIELSDSIANYLLLARQNTLFKGSLYEATGVVTQHWCLSEVWLRGIHNFTPSNSTMFSGASAH